MHAGSVLPGQEETLGQRVVPGQGSVTEEPCGPGGVVVSDQEQVPERPASHAPDRNLALELVRVTEAGGDGLAATFGWSAPD